MKSGRRQRLPEGAGEPRLRLVKPLTVADHAPANLEQRLARRIMARAAAFLGLNLYTEASGEETPADQLRARLKQAGVLTEVQTLGGYPDEPRLFRSAAKTVVDTDGHTPSYGGGGGRHWNDPETAELIALVEAAERYCLYRIRDLRQARYRDLAPRALSPTDALEFSEEQRRHEPIRSAAQFDEESAFSWVSGWSVFGRHSVWLPAQRVFLNYRFPEGEPRLTSPSSNGGGAGFTLEQALWGALAELVERDAFFIFWHNRISPPRLNLEHSPSDQLRNLAKQMRRYRLEPTVLEITTDLGIPVFAVILRDTTNIGPAVRVAARAGFDREAAIAGALAEAVSGRINARTAQNDRPDRDTALTLETQRELAMTDRLRLWSKPEMKREIEFLLSGPEIEADPTTWHEQPTPTESLNRILNSLRAHGYPVYYWRAPVLPEIGLTVVKAIVPGLVQLYLDERYPLLASPRLREIPAALGYTPLAAVNPTPHPL
ncbi:YcaO-like family protein, partial [Candidatus Parcubacteria bacterium]|nr:YcaO-like family protein [Candidatus Parcubacteria bacterium]